MQVSKGYLAAMLKNQIAHLSINYLSKEHVQVAQMLRDAGFRVVSTSVSGLGEPEVTIRGMTFQGIEGIKQLIESTSV
jgi:hypothetical protein